MYRVYHDSPFVARATKTEEEKIVLVAVIASQQDAGTPS